ncbi:MAG: NAD(P)H-binding protein [Alteraurantiacibacter sp.]
MGENSKRSYFVSGASGPFGRKVIEALQVRGARVIAGARDPGALADLGVEVRACDYDKPETLPPALSGVDRVLLVSSNAVGRRVPQHAAVIDAAVAAGCEHFAYTSILHGLESPLALAEEHKATERYLLASGLSHTILRNAWYSENFEPNFGAAVGQGAIATAAGEGRFAPALRAELAEAAAVRLIEAELPSSEVLELAGSTSFSMPELAQALSARLGKQVDCIHMGGDAYAEMLTGFGIPAMFAEILADSETKAVLGAHVEGGKALERLIGRPTKGLTELVDIWFTAAQVAPTTSAQLEG